MVINKITGGKPQEVQKTEQADRKNAEVSKESSAKPSDAGSSTAHVSERSKAAIKAYRIAMESKPDISRVSRVAQIKAQIVQGGYKPGSSNVADSIINSIIKGG